MSLDHRPEADKAGMLRKSGDIVGSVRCFEIDPADHAPDEFVAVCEFEHVMRLSEGGGGLHENGAVNRVAFQMRFQILGMVVPVDRPEFRRQPPKSPRAISQKCWCASSLMAR